uniref:CSON005864 protein n=1 Tax=Culicoides sonorensis TaxID=179676 RepID=A0A336LIU7_CULSO
MKEFSFKTKVRPACIMEEPNFHLDFKHELVGLKEKFLFDGNELVKSYVKFQNLSVCQDFFKGTGIELDQEHHVCYGNMDYHLVPDTCQTIPGFPLTFEFGGLERSLPHIIGLNIFQNECGFGFPAVFTELSHHIDWIDSIIFQEPASIENEIEVPTHDFKHCPQTTAALRNPSIENGIPIQNFYQFAHLALIGYEATNDWHCQGNLITERHVLTSNECVNRTSNYDTVALGNATVFHKIENIVTNEHHLALITLNTSVSFSRDILPICLWLDKENIPFFSDAVLSFFPGTNLPDIPSIFRPHQAECHKAPKISNSVKTQDEACISNALHLADHFCALPGSGLQAIRNESGIIMPYLVGQLYDVDKIECNKENRSFDEVRYYAFTKIAYQIDWILNNVLY